MIDRRRLRQHALGWSLLLAWLFLALSVAGYRPEDPPGHNAWRPVPVVQNPCGPVGATLAHVLLVSLGWGSLLLLYALGVAGCFTPRFRKDPFLLSVIAIFGLELYLVASWSMK